MKKSFIFLFSAVLMVSCGGDKENDGSDETTGNSIVGNTSPDNSNSEANNSNVNMGGSSHDPNLETTTIEYFDLKHDFGNVFYPSENKYTFKFKNTGKVPLVIESATASCGCTIPNKPDAPIAPGAIGELDVIFRPKSGQVGEQVSKTITVTANTKPEQTFLEITAKVMDAM